MANNITAQKIAEMIQASQATGGIVSWAGGTTITGKGMDLAKLISAVSALRLESAGIRLSRGVSVLAIVRRDYGIKARTATQAHALLSALYAEGKALASKDRHDPAIYDACHEDRCGHSNCANCEGAGCNNCDRSNPDA